MSARNAERHVTQCQQRNNMQNYHTVERKIDKITGTAYSRCIRCYSILIATDPYANVFCPQGDLSTLKTRLYEENQKTN